MVRRLSDLHCILSCLQYYSSVELKVHVLGSSPHVLSHLWAPIICLVPLAEVREASLVSSCSPGHRRVVSLGLEGTYLGPLQQLTSFL